MTWTCERCDETMKENTSECTNCGYTVFRNVRSEGWISKLTPNRKSSRSSTDTDSWLCTKCGHEHDRKPFVCQECGSSWIRATSSKTTSTAEMASGPGLFGYLLLPFILLYRFMNWLLSFFIGYWWLALLVGSALVWYFFLG